jgi:chromosome segregation ATPase
MFVNLKNANARIAELEAELKTSEEILAAAQVNEERILVFEAEKAELESTVETLKAEKELSEAEAKSASTVATEAESQVEALKAEAKTAAAQAADLVASQGVDSDDAPAVKEEVAKSADEIHSQFISMPTGPERTAFYQKHRSALLG